MCDGPRPERRLRVPIDVPLHAGGAHRRERQAHATSEAAGAGKAEEGGTSAASAARSGSGCDASKSRSGLGTDAGEGEAGAGAGDGGGEEALSNACLAKSIKAWSRLTDAEGLMRGCGLGMRSAAARGGGRGRKAGGGGGVGERPCGGASIRGTLIAVSVQKLCRQLTRASHV